MRRFEGPARTAEDLDWLSDDVNRDEYHGRYGSDGWTEPCPCCPAGGAELVSQSYYVGSKRYKAFMICSRDAEHWALLA